MCGRFVQATPGEVVAGVFGLDAVPHLAPRYNVAPTQPVAAVRARDGKRELVMLHWGLIPSWAKDAEIGNRMINARSETVAEKPAFRSAFASRRCLIPASGFYEWQKRAGGKQPYYVRMKDEGVFAMAGLWERWAPAGAEPVESCTIVTTSANGVLALLHDRMPVIVHPRDFVAWLDPSLRDKGALAEFLRPYPAGEMTAYPVSKLVNSPGNDDPTCIQPLG